MSTDKRCIGLTVGTFTSILFGGPLGGFLGAFVGTYDAGIRYAWLAAFLALFSGIILAVPITLALLGLTAFFLGPMMQYHSKELGMLIAAPIAGHCAARIGMMVGCHYGWFAQARNGDIESLATLLTSGINVNSSDSSGRTALHYAASTGDSETIRFLLASGILVDKPDCDHCTALHFAAEFGQLRAAELLLTAGADPFRRSMDGSTPFVRAHAKGFLEVAQLLSPKCCGLLVA